MTRLEYVIKRQEAEAQCLEALLTAVCGVTTTFFLMLVMSL